MTTRTGQTNAAADPFARRALAWLLMTLLAFAPLPFGGARPWAWSLIAAATGLLLCLWAAGVWADRAMRPVLPRCLWPVLALFVAPLLWAALQASPLTPPGWHHPLWRAAAAVLAAPVAGSVSIDRPATVGALTRLLAYGGVFFLVLQTCRTGARATWLLRGIVAAALVYAGYGMAVRFLGFDSIPWLAEARDAGNLSGTFLDRNAFATFAGLGLVAAAALVFRPKFREGDLEGGWRIAIRTFIDYFFARSWRSLSAAALLFAAVVLTHSRAGLLAAAIGVIVFFVAVTRTWRSRKPAVLGALAIVLAGAVIFLVSGAGTVQRLALLPKAASERSEIYRLTAAAIAERPFAGTGYGTFADVFPAYRSESLIAPLAHGHNIYLENALELGVPAAAALVLAVGGIAWICLRAVRRSGREAVYPAVGLAATALVGAHSLFDSSLRVPAVAITFAAILGIACARSLAVSEAPDADDDDESR